MVAHRSHQSLRWALPLVLLAITTTAVYLFHHTQSSDDAFFDALLQSQPAYEPMPESDWRYCDIDDIVHGTWVANRDFEDYSSIFDAFKLKAGADTKCERVAPLTPDQQMQSKENQAFERVKAIAIPSLKPLGNCKMLEMDRRMIIKRLLRSPAGLTIVGDSISQYTFQIWADMLAIDPGLITKTRVSEFHYTLEVNPKSNHATALVEEAGVSVRRLAYPIVSFHRHDQLLVKDELVQVMQRAGDRANVVLDKEGDSWFPLWVQLLKESNGVPVENGKEETSLIVLNTGSFWSSKSLGSKVEEEDVDDGYQNMFQILKSKIREVPYPVASYWRSLTPAHLDCAASTTFNNTKADWASPISGNLRSWNYHWYERMNGIAEGNTVHHRARHSWNFQGIKSRQDINPPMRFVDVWEMTLKRPEAHMRPPQDCLHLCMIGVMNYWQQLLWNLIVQESRNSDYDGLTR